jgi:hypothetical protein
MFLKRFNKKTNNNTNYSNIASNNLREHGFSAHKIWT